MKKTKTEPKRPIHKIQLGRVHYLYQVGISWIAIETDPKTKWAEMPEYMRVCFGIETPSASQLSHLLEPHYALESFVYDAIKRKIKEQRKAYAGTVGTNKPMGKRNNKSSAAAKPSGMPDAKRKGGGAGCCNAPF